MMIGTNSPQTTSFSGVAHFSIGISRSRGKSPYPKKVTPSKGQIQPREVRFKDKSHTI